MSAEIIKFVARSERAASTAATSAASTQDGDDRARGVLRGMHSETFFQLPFVTLPEEPAASWGEFWRATEMWNAAPEGKPHEDSARGRQYARMAIEAIQQDSASGRQLELTVERMIERAFNRRGKGGRLCRQLDYAAHGFIAEICKAALWGRSS